MSPRNLVALFWLLAATAALSSCGSSATTATSPTTVTRCAVTASGPSTVPAQGGTGTVNVAAARECAWTASIDGAWLTLRSNANGQGDGTVDFAAAANPDPATRRGAIVLNSQRVEITQAAGECVMGLAENAASFGQNGGGGRVDVRASSAMCAWTAESDSSWIALRSSSGQGSATVLFDVEPTTGPPRSGVLKIAGQRFSVTQSEGCAYSINPAAFPATASGGAGAVAIATAPGCPWTAGSNVPWLTLSQTDGVGPNSVTFTVAPTSGATRTGTAVIAGQTFTVTQSDGCVYAVDPLTQSVDAAGGTVSVRVTSGAGCSWTASSAVPWITLNGPASSSGSGTVTFTVAATTGPARSDTVTVAGKPVAISQAPVAGPSCTYSISPESASVPPSGGTGTVALTTGASCAWTAASNAPWLSITSATSGSGNTTIAFTAAAELTGAPRTGTLSIAGLTFTVTQSGGCVYTISPEVQTVDAEGATVTVNVTAPNGCAWSTSTTTPWITVQSKGPEQGNGRVEVTAARNTGAARTGTVTIAGRTFTLNQSAALCTYAVDPTSFSIGADDKRLRVDVTTASHCSWTAVSGVPWISVTMGATGTGSGEVRLSVLANDGAERIGTTTVAGFTVTVTQKQKR